jgi:hypothetical protein
LRSQVFRPLAILLSVLLLASTPVHAGPLAIGDVIQVIGNYQNPPELRLRNSSQTSSTHTAGMPGNLDSVDGLATFDNSDSLLSGVVVNSQDPQSPVNIGSQGDIEGAVCDCGVVTVGSGFPKWPLLFLAAIPFFFIDDDDCDDCEKVTPTPTPVPTPTPTTPTTPTPEPASLLLFGSGLAAVGASLRRRRLKAKLNAQVETAEEG